MFGFYCKGFHAWKCPQHFKTRTLGFKLLLKTKLYKGAIYIINKIYVAFWDKKNGQFTHITIIIQSYVSFFEIMIQEVQLKQNDGLFPEGPVWCGSCGPKTHRNLSQKKKTHRKPDAMRCDADAHYSGQQAHRTPRIYGKSTADATSHAHASPQGYLKICPPFGCHLSSCPS
jgi:hypothetical protein